LLGAFEFCTLAPYLSALGFDVALLSSELFVSRLQPVTG
jgi:hypothetical protein